VSDASHLGQRSQLPESPQYWDAVAAEWQADRDALWRRHSDAVNVALCRRWLPPRVRRLLKTDAFDEASSAGLWPWLIGLADRVEAIDYSPAVAARARGRQPKLSATTADVRNLPFVDRSFDAVVSNSTLDHFTGTDAIGESLLELRRVLVPGGRLLLTLDNPANPLVALRNALPFSWLNRVRLVPYFVGATLESCAVVQLLDRVGFDVLEVTAILHCPRVLAVPAARLVGRFSPEGQTHARFLRVLARFEAAEQWPTRYRTGHFVAVLATRRGDR
jgi:SAM-dependent methyltransferase